MSQILHALLKRGHNGHVIYLCGDLRTRMDGCRSFHTQVVSHPIFFSDQIFYCSNIIIIIIGKVTKIVYICIIYKISAQKLKYLIYM